VLSEAECLVEHLGLKKVRFTHVRFEKKKVRFTLWEKS